MTDETEIRIRAFQWLRDREQWNDGIFSGRELNDGFLYNGQKITLKGALGIWYPAGFSMPISITTAKNGPYELDGMGDDGFLVYAYQGKDYNHRANRGLREAMRTRTPLIYFKEVHSHRYQAIWPMMILEDYPDSLYVRAVVDPAYSELRPGLSFEDTTLSPLDLRRYAWTYDQNILGVDADYTVHVREDILREKDGPMLKHGIQELNGSRLILPRRSADKPDQDRLSQRFEAFMVAVG